MIKFWSLPFSGRVSRRILRLVVLHHSVVCNAAPHLLQKRLLDLGGLIRSIISFFFFPSDEICLSVNLLSMLLEVLQLLFGHLFMSLLPRGVLTIPVGLVLPLLSTVLLPCPLLSMTYIKKHHVLSDQKYVSTES